MAMKKKPAGTSGKNRVIIRTPASIFQPTGDRRALGQFERDGLCFDGCWPKETVSAPFSNVSRTQPQSPAGASSSGGIGATKGRLG